MDQGNQPIPISEICTKIYFATSYLSYDPITNIIDVDIFIIIFNEIQGILTKILIVQEVLAQLLRATK